MIACHFEDGSPFLNWEKHFRLRRNHKTYLKGVIKVCYLYIDPFETHEAVPKLAGTRVAVTVGSIYTKLGDTPARERSKTEIYDLERESEDGIYVVRER